MNSPAELDIGPLSWVKDEIELALGRGAELLRKYAGQQDAALLAEACASLHQAHGALAIVGLDGVTEFSSAIERLLDALTQGELAWSPALGEAAQAGIAALRQYLDELIGGRPNQPLRLLPVYRQLNEARGVAETLAADLFFPDLTQRPPKREASALDEAARQARLKAARLGFERGLAKWLKQDAGLENAGLRDMRNSIAIIEALQEQPAARAFWWVALAWFDALAAGGIADDATARHLCGRIDAQVKKLLDGTQAVAERLMRDVLYDVATAAASNEHIELVRAVYGLNALLPVAATDPREVALGAMRGCLVAANESWEQFCAGAAIALPRFHEQSAQLTTLAREVGQVDLARLAAALANVANLLRKNPLLHGDELGGEVATALLLAENAVNHFNALDVDFAAQIDALTGRLNALQRGETPPPHELPALQALARRAAGRLALQQVARDLRTDLQLVEQALDTFFRDSSAAEAIATLGAPLKDVALMFDRLGQPRAVQVTQECEQSIASFAAPGHERKPGEFEEVARKISALGFFVEQLQRGPADLDALLAPPAAVAATPSVEAELSQMARMMRTLVGSWRDAPDDAPRREALRGELKQNLESVRDNARLVADATIERQAVAALSALDSEAAPEHVEAAVAELLPLEPEAPAPNEETERLAHASADDVDSELLAIFVEEAVQVIDTVSVQLYHSMARPDDAECLGVLRRCFHTLKGSSRMVGLRDFSEAAHAVEIVLDRQLQGGKPAPPELHALVDTAQRIVSDWIERLQRRANAPDIAPLLRQCAAMRQQDAPAATGDATISIGPLRLRRGVYDIYLDEARAHLAVLEQDLRQAQCVPTARMLRAAHTLAGASAALDIAPVQALAESLQHALERFAQAATVIDPAPEGLPWLALQRLAAMVADLGQQHYPDAADELVPRLDALRPPASASAAVTASAPASHDLLPLFFEECADLLPAVATAFRAWRGEGERPDNRKAESLQRILHTLKGSARMAGATEIGADIHDIETRVVTAHADQAPTPALIDELQGDFDRVAAAIDELRSTHAADIEAPRPMLRVRADLVDTMVNESGEIAIARSRIEGGVKSLRASLGDLTENVARLRSHLRELEIQAESRIQSNAQAHAQLHGAQRQDFDPLEMDRFTRLQELTRILAESVNDVATVEHSLMRDLDQVDGALTQQARISRELAQRLMGVRMVPFASIAERLRRVARMTAEEAGKKVAFTIAGGETELDRAVLERITGPIEHLLRNAVVHGIEPAERRAAIGKPAQGEVRLVLTQAGNELVISVGDDGGGFDFARLRAEAEKRGLLAAGQPASESQLAQLVYQPGFTTATVLSKVAGRGIGMDVVRNEIAALGGHVDMQAEAGRGASFILHLPLTLAVIPVVLVKSGARTFAIPASMVAQASEMKVEAMMRLRAAAEVAWQEQRFALHYLPHLLGDAAAQPQPRRRHWVLLLRGGAQRIALEIDALVGNEEVVIKNIGPQLARVPGISGATVLGDGEVVLIVNPVGLLNARQARAALGATLPPREPPPEAKLAPAPPTVMVVDDSLTVRKITGRLLERAGYRVMAAKDGLDALEQLAELVPDVMLADIEMPRMDGFELARRLRADKRFAALPIIMITSRIADKHRNYAQELGVNHYLGKPYDEQGLLAMIAEFISDAHGRQHHPGA